MQPKPNNDSLVDLSYIMDLSGGREDFINQVLTIFMENTPPGLKELEELVHKTNKWDAISKKAHFLKSSLGIIKIQGMHERLQQIETLAKEQKEKETIKQLLDEVVATFAKAEVIIREKMTS